MPTNRRGALKDALAAIYGLLNVAAMTAVAPGGVHHGTASPNLTSDYVVLQAPIAEPWDTMQNPGERDSFQIACVAFKPDYGQALRIAQVAKQLVDGERPTIANHLCVQCRWVEDLVYQTPELVNGQPSFRCVSTYELLVDQTS